MQSSLVGGLEAKRLHVETCDGRTVLVGEDGTVAGIVADGPA